MARNKREKKKIIDTGHHLPDLARSFIWGNSLPGESWHEIQDTNGKYYISNQARVLSLCNDGYMLREVQTKYNGYQYIDLSIDGKRKRLYIHILVASEFLPKPKVKGKTKLEVHHINRVRADNRADNLLWMTKAEHRALHTKLNQQDKAEAEARPPIKGGCSSG